MNRNETLQSGYGSLLNQDFNAGQHKNGLLKTLSGKLPKPKLPRLRPFSRNETAAETSRTGAGLKETLDSDAQIITDVLPHSHHDKNPIRYDDIGDVMKWAQHPTVRGHIYQLESGPEDIYRNRWGAYLEYYRGIKDDEGFEVEDRKSVMFIKAVHNDKMIGITSIRWKFPRFYDRGRTAYLERIIVDPELPPRKKIGLALGIEVGLNMFYKYDGYTGGLPATEGRTTTYADDEGEGFERNERFMVALGYEHHKDVIKINNRRIRPWRQTRASFVAALPDALKRVRKDQPDIADRLEEEWIRLDELDRGDSSRLNFQQ